MGKIQSYKDLLVWQKSILLVKEVYKVIAELPKIEQYALADQMRRSVISIPSNIAEGFRRRSKADYLQFLNIANGSAAETETQLIITSKIYHITVGQALSLLVEIQKMLYSLIQKIR